MIKPADGSSAPQAQTFVPDNNTVTVRQGDTLGDIAKHNNVSVEDLLKANPTVKDPNRIKVGQALVIPHQAPAAQTAGSEPRNVAATPSNSPSAATSQSAWDSFTGEAGAMLRKAELLGQAGLKEASGLKDRAVNWASGLFTKEAAPGQKVDGKGTALSSDEKKIDDSLAQSRNFNADANAITDRLFYERHPDLKGKAIGKGSPEAAEWQKIRNDEVQPGIDKAVGKLASDTKTSWPEKSLTTDSSDNAKADEIFYQRHPDLKDKPLKKGSDEAKEWSQIRMEVVQNKYNDALAKAAKEFPGLEPKMLKSLLVTESNMNPGVVNSYGFAGIAQFGKPAAKDSGLKVDEKVDERLDPEKAIPAAARHLKDKATALESIAFSKYGKPSGDEYTKFVLAAYNGGEGTVAKAMELAYNKGLDEAKGKGLKDDAAVSYAQAYATKWDHLSEPKTNPTEAPLYKAADEAFGKLEEKDPEKFKDIVPEKYREIGNYPISIVNRARQ